MQIYKYILVPLVLAVIGFFYILIYYKRMNKVINNNKLRLIKISPISFLLLLLIIFISIVIPLSIIEVKALNNKIDSLEEYVIEDRYANWDSFPVRAFEIVYESYNNNFGGIYLDGNQTYMICITNDSPPELVRFLDANYNNYVFVEFSYAELLQLYRIIHHDILYDKQYISSLGLNEMDNQVHLNVTSEAYDNSKFEYYIEIGILTIEIVDGYQLL